MCYVTYETNLYNLPAFLIWKIWILGSVGWAEHSSADDTSTDQTHTEDSSDYMEHSLCQHGSDQLQLFNEKYFNSFN